MSKTAKPENHSVSLLSSSVGDQFFKVGRWEGKKGKQNPTQTHSRRGCIFVSHLSRYFRHLVW